ncbi:unnamed protein product [Cyprideis torosa]|uniref:Latrophilin Cirl n=1 Tax=Cyprideis torosa TaxID=163714 RepID=A0A7R8WDF4_9CRUS|nr:unnamed protein product [Cyprideis torosa]CAG0888939.1 unnamed protein product [Cyprideis torosa]
MSVRLVRSDTLSSDAPMAFPSSHEKDVWSNLATGESSAIALPPEVMQENQQQDGMSRIVFFLYDQLDGILGAETLSKANTSKILVSKIISASLGKGRHVELSSPALMTFKLTQNTTNLTDPQCVFWDYTTSVWSMDGCRVLDYNGSHVACSCDHLTHFAVLMSVVTPASQVSPVHEKNLQVISYVGCILSIICLFAALVTFQFCVSNSCDRTVIHKHLCFCLLVAELVFVIGLQQTSVPAFCGVVAGILHYMFLAAFTWMFIEGFQVYVMLIEVFESEKSRLRWYYLLGYGIPALIVAISCIVDPFSYGTPDYCWLRSDNYFVFSFIGPVIVILLANVLFLSLGIAVVCRHRHSSLSLKEQSRMENLSSALRMSISLVFLLGLTWTFGIMFVTSNNVVMAYIFTVVNTLQGVFIFLLTCLQNEKVARFYARIWEQLQCCERTPDRKNGFYVTGAGTGQGSNSTNSSAVTSPNSLIVDEYMATSVISANCLATLQKNGGNGNTGPFSMNTCALHVAAIQNELGAGGPQNGQYTMHAAHPHQGTAPPTYHAQAVMTNSKHHPRCVSSAGFRSFAHPIPPTCDVNAYGAHNGFCLRCRSLSMLNNAAAAGGTYSPYNHTYTEIDPIYSEIDGRTPACGCGNPLNGGGGGQVPGNPVTHRVINSVSARISPAVSCPPPSYFQNPTPPAPAPSQRTAQSFGLSSPASHQHRHQISNTSQGSVNVSRQSSQSYQSENRPLISEAPSSASQGPMTATSSRAGGLMKMDSTDSNGGEPRLPVYHV